MYLFSIRQFVRLHIGLEIFPGTPGHCLASTLDAYSDYNVWGGY